MPKTKNPASNATTDRARRSALAEIDARVAALDGATAATATDATVPATVAPETPVAESPALGSPVPPKAAKGRTGGKAARAEKPAKAPKASKPAKETRLSCLDAAAKVLADAGKPMKPAEMIEVMEAKGLWKTASGKTPSATLYAAIIREIGAKRKEARFRKTQRGTFEHTGVETE